MVRRLTVRPTMVRKKKKAMMRRKTGMKRITTTTLPHREMQPTKVCRNCSVSRSTTHCSGWVGVRGDRGDAGLG